MNSESLPQSPGDQQERRFKAVSALPASQVVAQSGICRSDLYKLRKRALEAMWDAMCDHPKGPKNPHNRLGKEKEAAIKSICERHLTLLVLATLKQTVSWREHSAMTAGISTAYGKNGQLMP